MSGAEPTKFVYVEPDDSWLQELTQYLKRCDPVDIIADIPDNAFNLEKGCVPVPKLGATGQIHFRRYFTEAPTVILWLLFKVTEPELGSATTSPQKQGNTNSESQSPKAEEAPKKEVRKSLWVSKLPNSKTYEENRSPSSDYWGRGKLKNPNEDLDDTEDIDSANINNDNNSNNSNSNNNNNNNNNNNQSAPNSPPTTPVKAAEGKDKEVYCNKIFPVAYEVGINGVTVRRSEIFAVDPSAELHYIAFNRTKPVDPTLKNLIPKIAVGSSDSLQLVREWVESGHHISSTNSDDQNLLHVACQHSQENAVKWLVERGIELEKRDKNGWTPLLSAINACHIQIIDYLIKKNAMTQPVFTTNGSSYFHYLTRIVPTQPETDMYLRILEDTCKVYKSKSCQANFAQETPLHRAASSGNLVALTWLLDFSRPFHFDPNTANLSGETVLHEAVKSGNPKVVRYLIKHFRIDVHARNSPNSPYNLAVTAHKTDIAQLFPVAAKMRLYDLNSFLLQNIVDNLDVRGLARCLGTNHKLRDLAKTTLHTKHHGMSPAKMILYASIERSNELLRQDLEAVSTPAFLEGWNRQGPPGTHPEHVKIIMVGARGVGATTLLHSLMSPTEIEEYRANNSEHYQKNIYCEGQIVKTQVWDKVHKPHNYTDVPVSHFRGTSVILVLYDSSSPDSTKDMKNWLHMFDRHTFHTLLIFVGTKADVISQDRVSDESMREHLKLLAELPECYVNFSAKSPSETLRYPYVVETRMDNPESLQRVIRLAAYMGVRFKRSLAAAPQRIVGLEPPAPPKKNIVSSLKKFLKK